MKDSNLRGKKHFLKERNLLHKPSAPAPGPRRRRCPSCGAAAHPSGAWYYCPRCGWSDKPREQRKRFKKEKSRMEEKKRNRESGRLKEDSGGFTEKIAGFWRAG